MKVAIVTDSTADIPADLVEANHIEIVPNLIIMDGKSLIDNEEISRNEFYERLPHMKSLPTTATASSGAYQNLYERLFKQGFDTILSIHASQLLSGIFNAASGAAQAFGDRVHVIDSEQVTMSLGWQVLAAAEAAASYLSLEEILGQVSDVRQTRQADRYVGYARVCQTQRTGIMGTRQPGRSITDQALRRGA